MVGFAPRSLLLGIGPPARGAATPTGGHRLCQIIGTLPGRGTRDTAAPAPRTPPARQILRTGAGRTGPRAVPRAGLPEDGTTLLDRQRDEGHPLLSAPAGEYPPPRRPHVLDPIEP